MKKFIGIVLAVVLSVMLTGCGQGEGLYVDRGTIYLRTIGNLDQVIRYEQKFLQAFNFYITDRDVRLLEVAVRNFGDAYGVMDRFIADTDFAPQEQSYEDDYYDYYKPTLERYLLSVQDAFAKIEVDNDITDEELRKWYADFKDQSFGFIDVQDRYVDMTLKYYGSSLITEEIKKMEEADKTQ